MLADVLHVKSISVPTTICCAVLAQSSMEGMTSKEIFQIYGYIILTSVIIYIKGLIDCDWFISVS